MLDGMTIEALPSSPPNAAAILARKRTSAARRASDFVANWLHYIDDGPLWDLAREVYAEVDERERTRARTTDEDAGG